MFERAAISTGGDQGSIPDVRCGRMRENGLTCLIVALLTVRINLSIRFHTSVAWESDYITPVSMSGNLNNVNTSEYN